MTWTRQISALKNSFVLESMRAIQSESRYKTADRARSGCVHHLASLWRKHQTQTTQKGRTYLSFRFQVSQTRGLTGSAGPDETVSGVKRYRGAGWLTPRQIERRQRERQTDRQREIRETEIPWGLEIRLDIPRWSPSSYQALSPNFPLMDYESIPLMVSEPSVPIIQKKSLTWEL